MKRSLVGLCSVLALTLAIIVPETVAAQYKRDGFVVLRRVLSSDLVKEMQGHVDWLLQQYPDIPPEQLHHPLIKHGMKNMFTETRIGAGFFFLLH